MLMTSKYANEVSANETICFLLVQKELFIRKKITKVTSDTKWILVLFWCILHCCRALTWALGIDFDAISVIYSDYRAIQEVGHNLWVYLTRLSKLHFDIFRNPV